jgi:ParB family chromosome partitioning protein
VNVPRGLGRGLGALLPTSASQELGTPGARYDEIAVAAVAPNPRQPRENFNPDGLTELAASIREVGLLQPIVVRETAPGAYELVMGERRLRASREAGLDRVPAIIRETPDDEMLREALLENLQREQLNPLEEAAAYRSLLSDFGATHEQLAGKLGKSRSHVTNTLRLLNLPPGVQRRVAAGTLSAGHARALLALTDGTAQERLADRIVAEGLSVRAVEEIVAVGDAPAAPPRPRPAKPVAPALAELSASLSDFLETRVRVELGRRKGKIVIEFASVDDLQRLAQLMGAPTPIHRAGLESS